MGKTVKILKNCFVQGKPAKVGDVIPDVKRWSLLVGSGLAVLDDGKEAVVSAEETEESEDEQSEIDTVRAQLDELGVKYSAKAKLETLRVKLAEAQADD